MVVYPGSAGMIGMDRAHPGHTRLNGLGHRGLRGQGHDDLAQAVVTVDESAHRVSRTEIWGWRLMPPASILETYCGIRIRP